MHNNARLKFIENSIFASEGKFTTCRKVKASLLLLSSCILSPPLIPPISRDQSKEGETKLKISFNILLEKRYESTQQLHYSRLESRIT